MRQPRSVRRNGEKDRRGPGGETYDDGGLEVDEDAAGHVLARAGLGEEGAEGVVDGAVLVGGEAAIWLDAVLEAVELPAGVAHLNTTLANVDRDNLTHVGG